MMEEINNKTIDTEEEIEDFDGDELNIVDIIESKKGTYDDIHIGIELNKNPTIPKSLINAIGYGSYSGHVSIYIFNHTVKGKMKSYTSIHKHVFNAISENKIPETIPIYKDKNRLGKRKSKLVMSTLNLKPIEEYIITVLDNSAIPLKGKMVDGRLDPLCITIAKEIS